MGYLEINSRYQELLEQHGLGRFADFLALPAVIIGGHADRNVARVMLGSGPGAVRALLKREHCVRWKDRVLNACAGFGFVSKSQRECRMLQYLADAGIGCADWMAAGEDGNGHAFLLVRELEETSDLRLHLSGLLNQPAQRRRRFALRLGTALARLHNAGFQHPDLYSKHVAVDENQPTIYFLDLQRARRHKRVSWSHRWRDLAGLDATLNDDILPTRDRLTCLRAYLRACRRDGVGPCPSPMYAAFRIFHRAASLLVKRRIQESCRLPRANVLQHLLWLDGEALCVTPEFIDMLRGSVPDWLLLHNMPRQGEQLLLEEGIGLDNGRRVRLVRRRELRLRARLWSAIRHRRVASPELRQSGILFRLERAGLRVPKLLAFGQRHVRALTVESFLLTEVMDGTSLAVWGERPRGGGDDAGIRQRRLLIKQAGRFLQQLHGARCYFTGRTRCGLAIHVEGDAETRPIIALAAPDQILTRRRPDHHLQRANLLAVRRDLGNYVQTRTDQLRLVLSYLGIERLNRPAKRLLRALLHVRGQPARTARPGLSCPIHRATYLLPGRSAL